jgi:two-component system sensor kinase FixL
MAWELSNDQLRAARLLGELLESQKRMALAASAAELSLWEWDVARDEIWTTERGRERIGVSGSEHIDLARFLQAVHPDDREQARMVIRRAAEGGQDLGAEYRVMTPGGPPRWVAVRGQTELGAAGKPVLMRGVSIDVTERRQVDAKLRKQRDELAFAQRVSVMGQLASALAHELSQPLGAILRNAEAADLAEVKAILSDIQTGRAASRKGNRAGTLPAQAP